MKQIISNFTHWNPRFLPVFHIVYFLKQVVTALVLVLLVVLQSAGQDLCCLRTQEASVGRGADEATVHPANAKVVKTVGEAAEKEATAKSKVIIGKCVCVSDGDTVHVVTDGNVKFKVRLDRIDAPEKDQPYGKESTAYLSSLICGKTVRVEWQKKDRYGRILGIVYLDKADVNLQMVATGNAHHYSYFNKTAVYAAAESAAKEQKLGLWASDNVVSPYQWRKNKRRM